MEQVACTPSSEPCFDPELYRCCRRSCTEQSGGVSLRKLERREVWHGAHGSVRFDPSDLRMVGGEIFSRANQTKDDRQARKDDCRCGETQGANPRAAGAVLWPLLLRRAASAVVRDDRASSWLADNCAHAKARAALPHGADRARPRSPDDRRG